MRLAVADVTIAAPPEIVFELFTTAAGLEEWMAVEATVDLRPGGSWRWVHENGNACSGEYLEIEPSRRLVFTYGWESGEFADVAPGSTRVEVTFAETGHGTEVRVEHSGLVGDRPERHTFGWTHFLGRLGDAAVGRTRRQGGG